MFLSRYARLGGAESEQGRPAVMVCKESLDEVWVGYGSLKEDRRQRSHVPGVGSVRLQATEGTLQADEP